MKFKVGDIVQHKKYNNLVYEIINIKYDLYTTKLMFDLEHHDKGLIEVWWSGYCDNWELYKPKEIKEFLPSWF